MSGKTTFLDAVHLAYEGVANARKPRWHPGFDPDDPTLRRDPNRPIEVDIEFSLDLNEFAAMCELLVALGAPGNPWPSATHHLRYVWPPAVDSAHAPEELRPTNAQLAFRGRALAAMALARKVATERYLDEVGGLIYLDQARRGRLLDDARRSSFPLRPGPFPRDLLSFLTKCAILDLKWDPATQGESAWSRCKRFFHELASPAAIDDVKASDEGYDLRLKRDGGYYYSSGTSSGERQMLRLAANLVHAHAVRSVVLIDEVELNLHPRWQRNALHFCQSGGDDDNQFIVTTHSDTLLRYVDPACVVVLGDLGAA